MGRHHFEGQWLQIRCEDPGDARLRFLQRGQRQHDHRLRVVPRKQSKRDLGDDAQDTERPHEQFGHVVAADVLHGAAAELDRAAICQGGPDAQHHVSQSAVGGRAGSLVAGGHHAADGSVARIAWVQRQDAPHGFRPSAGLGHRRTRGCGKGQVVGVHVGAAGQAGRAEQHIDAPRGRAPVPLREPATDVAGAAVPARLGQDRREIGLIGGAELLFGPDAPDVGDEATHRPAPPRSRRRHRRPRCPGRPRDRPPRRACSCAEACPGSQSPGDRRPP